MEEQFKRQTEEEFLAEVQTNNPLFEEDKQDGYDIHAFWNGGEYHTIGVLRKQGKQATYIIQGHGDDDDPEDDNEYIRTMIYEKFCQALDEIEEMSYDQYCATFC